MQLFEREYARLLDCIQSSGLDYGGGTSMFALSLNVPVYNYFPEFSCRDKGSLAGAEHCFAERMKAIRQHGDKEFLGFLSSEAMGIGDHTFEGTAGHKYQIYADGGALQAVHTLNTIDMYNDLPAEVAYSAVMLILLAKEFNLKAGFMRINLGECYIRECDADRCADYINLVAKRDISCGRRYTLTNPNVSILEFKRGGITV